MWIFSVDIEDDKEDYALGAQEVTQVSSTFKSTLAEKREMRSEVKGKADIKNCGILTDRALLEESKGLEFEVHFKLSQDEPHVLLGEIAQKTTKRVYMKACKNHELCSVVEPKRTGDPLLLQTAGVNFKVLCKLFEYIDIHKIVTNNIHEMLKTYGVEAVRATILNEVKGVFNAYGIAVNVRHLMLIAYLMMRYNGDYRSLNELGMRKFNTSHVCAMSFETATNIITESALHGFVDTMDSPSACVSLGKIVNLGAGSFDLLQNIQLSV